MGVPARVFSISLAGCAALALAGCDASGSGGTSGSVAGAASEPSAASLVSAAQSSVRNASSVHVSGQLSREGVPVSVNLNVTRNGDLAGTVRERGTPLQVIAADGKIYIQASAAFLREMNVPAAACATSCGKWLEFTEAEAGQLTGDLSLQNLLTPLKFGQAGTSGPAGKLTPAGSTTVQGERAWLVRASDGATVAVSSSGHHYPLRSVSGGSAHQVVTYSRWNSAPVPKPPAASQLLTLDGG
jgi:hypothetical protein